MLPPTSAKSRKMHQKFELRTVQGHQGQNFWMKLTLQKLEGWGYNTVKIA